MFLIFVKFRTISGVDKQLLCCFLAGLLVFFLAAVISRYAVALVACHFCTLLLAHCHEYSE